MIAASGCQEVIVSSASAKTAYGTAFELHRKGVCVVRLTSPRNRDFTVGLGIYDEVFTYGEIDSLSADVPLMLADFTESWDAFLPAADNWVTVAVGPGADGLAAAWREVHAGRTDASVGYIIAL